MKHFTKSILALIITLTAFTFTTKAQSVQQGSSIISVGYGFPNLGKSIYNAFNTYSDYKVRGIGPLHFKYEYMLSDNIGIGTSINLVNFSATYNGTKDVVDVNGNVTSVPTIYKLATTNYSVLFRFNYHFITDDKIDFYYGVGAGYRGGKTTWTSTPTDPDFAFTSGTVIPIGFETTLGLRYFITDNIGLYTEIGAAKSLIQFGACVKL